MYKKIKYACVGQGVLRASIVTMLCVLVYSLITSFTPSSPKVTSAFIVVLTLVSVLYGTVFATLKSGNKGWLIGLLVAFFYMLILYIVSVLCGNGFGIDAGDLIRLLLALAVGSLSGMLAVNLSD
ncbi:TIGR04086 family membrane protein [Clostridium sp.]|uniref:TIGR04086 family membrane protein n=1 Tax=Clostridium sp. TaxID=1506 RepID=UPI002FCC46B2